MGTEISASILSGSKAKNIAIHAGEHLIALDLAEVSGYVIVYQGGTFTAPKYDSDLVFHEIENDGEYALCRNANGLYRAGCRGPFTEEQALEHWDGRQDRRATLFAAAIRNAGAL